MVFKTKHNIVIVLEEGKKHIKVLCGDKILLFSKRVQTISGPHDTDFTISDKAYFTNPWQIGPCWSYSLEGLIDAIINKDNHKMGVRGHPNYEDFKDKI